MYLASSAFDGLVYLFYLPYYFPFFQFNRVSVLTPYLSIILFGSIILLRTK